MGVGISRRQLLIGGGSAAVLAAVGIGAADVFDHSQFERGLHKVGLASSPSIRLPSSGSLEQNGTFLSRYMKRPVNWMLSRPAGAQPLQGTIFCLHGKGTNDGTNQRFAFDAVHVPDAAAYVCGPASSRRRCGWGRRQLLAPSSERNELTRHAPRGVRAHGSEHGRSPAPSVDGVVDGWILLAAERAHDQFVAVAPASPALWLTPGATAPGAFDSPTDFYANDVFTDLSALSDMPVAVACGTSDPFYATTCNLVEHMSYPHTDFFGPGFHDAAYWASVAPDQLRAIAPSFT